MKVHRFSLVVAVMLAVPAVSLAGEEAETFSSALASYFGVSAEEVAAVWETGVSGDEIPVALLLAKLTKSSPANFGKLRARGDSWRDIAKVRNVGSDAFYMKIDAKFESATFSPIFAHFDTTSESKWRELPLTDGDVVNLVNLKFISSHFDYSAFEVMSMRDKGNSFVDITAHVKSAKEEMLKKEKMEQRKKKKEESD